MIKASIIDSSMRMMEDNTSCNTCYGIYYFNELFDVELFKRSVLETIKGIPVLSCRLKSGLIRDHWVKTDISNVIMEEELDVNKEEFYQYATDYFINMQGKTIDCEKEPPIRYIIFTLKNYPLYVVANCMHHSASDGVGNDYIFSSVCRRYNGEKVEDYGDSNYRGNIKITKLLGFKRCMNELKNMKAPDYMKEAMPLLDIENIEKQDIDRNSIYFSEFVISKENLEKLKNKYSCYKASTNDIVMYYSFLLIDKYNKDKGEINKGIPLSMKVNLRRYLTEPEPYVCNSFASQPVIMTKEDIQSAEKVMNELFRVKKSAMGIGYLMSIKMLSIFPVFILEKIVDKILGEINKMIFQGLSVTNSGKIDVGNDEFGKCLDDIKIIPCGSVYGFPVLVFFNFKGELRLSFTKYNDSNNFVEEIANEFENLILEDL